MCLQRAGQVKEGSEEGGQRCCQGCKKRRTKSASGKSVASYQLKPTDITASKLSLQLALKQVTLRNNDRKLRKNSPICSVLISLIESMLYHLLCFFQESTQVEEMDFSAGMYGPAPLNQSQTRLDRKVHRVSQLDASLIDQKVWIRGRLHTSRAKGKQCFFVLRQQQATVQCLVAVSETISKAFVKFVAG